MTSKLRIAGWTLAAAVLFAYGWVVLRGPQGLQALMERRREIRRLEERNASLERENQLRRERLKRLQDSPSEQEMEIRKQLKLLRPGETTFILPDAPKSENPQ
ncbi:MAG TPA: septum formation initiator family protein [Bryobacteraceae bacterium]|nr:septum formation initiator family protein [Bryobacteraceae bacterium]